MCSPSWPQRVIEECDYELEAGNHRRIARFWRAPPVHPRAGRRHLAQPPPGAGYRMGRRDRLRRGRRAARAGPRPLRRDHLPLLLRQRRRARRRARRPAPGQLPALRDDDRVSFFDFGMLRDLPRDLLARRRAACWPRSATPTRPALLDGDARARLPARARRRSGTPAPARGHARSRLVVPGPAAARLAPEDLWRGSESLRDGSQADAYEQLRRMTLPPEALLLRRMEGLLFQIASTVRAEADLGAAAPRAVEGGRPVDRARARARRLARRAPLTGGRRRSC